MSNDFFATTDSKTPAPIGYSGVIKHLENLKQSDKLPPVNLIEAPKGSGKRKLCEYLAAKLLGSTANQYSELNLHPDLLIIEADPTSAKQEVTIDRARKIKDFMQLTAAQAPAKVIIIDALDNLNLNAANSILKVLEEPLAGSYFFLVCHDSSKILDTILSRSHKIKLPKLNQEQFNDILQKNNIYENQDKLYELFPFQPGEAINFMESKGLDLLKELENILETKTGYQEKAFVGKYSFKKETQNFHNILPVIHYFIFKKIKTSSTNREVVTKLNDYINEFYSGFDQAMRLNLDRENFVLNNIFKLKKIYA